MWNVSSWTPFTKPRSYQARRKHAPRAARRAPQTHLRRTARGACSSYQRCAGVPRAANANSPSFFSVHLYIRKFLAIPSTSDQINRNHLSRLHPPSSRRKPTPISPQPSGRSTRNLNPTLGNNHPLITRVIGAAPPPLPRSLYAVNFT